MFNRDIISMPDKWEYPWYAAWDSAFHTIPLAHIDPHFAKEQLMLFLREWYMHPSGKLPAYEMELRRRESAGARLGLLAGLQDDRPPRRARSAFSWPASFTNCSSISPGGSTARTSKGKHLFAGGFLGLDNISVFDRSTPLPDGAVLEQADGTAWMAFYCGTMLSMALELAAEDPAYQDVASKFFEHFVAIADAMNNLGGTGLWDEEDGFYYDQMQVDGQRTDCASAPWSGIIPLLAVEILATRSSPGCPAFAKRMQWFLDNRRDLAQHMSYLEAQRARRPGPPAAGHSVAGAAGANAPLRFG